MNRRQFLQCAALLSAGGATVPGAWVLSQEQQRFLAARPPNIDQHTVDFFTTAQRAAVSAIANQVIPQTDTPGALEAGTPRFIELMVADWFNEAERATFMSGLEALQRRSGGDFASLPPAAQLAALEQLEDEAADASWYDPGSTVRLWDEAAPFICQIKELTVLGFALSEVGATRFLRLNPMGSFNGSYRLAPGDPSYDKDKLLRVMARESQP